MHSNAARDVDAMPSLQIRELPDGLYQTLALRAERAHRSLAQQALTDLRRALDAHQGERRAEVLAAIRADLAAAPATAAEADRVASPTPPEELIRADRGR
jgi:plasmid stability protein